MNDILYISYFIEFCDWKNDEYIDSIITMFKYFTNKYFLFVTDKNTYEKGEKV